MSNPYNAYLSAATGTNVQVKDYAHASRTFLDDNFRLFPKHNFLFHVVFGINQAAVKDLTTIQKNRNEISMLVKSAALPNFNVKTETINQYNRKKVIQTTHEYQPVTIKFRDDTANVVNKLWQNYYSYYYADTSSASQAGAYSRNAMGRIPTNKYGLDNGSTNPFFNYIIIYQLSAGQYTGYKLVNPVVTNWNHEGMDYTNTNAHENTMTLAYEAVAYSSGVISDDTPEGFGKEHYDTTPSPLATNNLPNPRQNTNVDSVTARNTRIEAASNIRKSIYTYQNSIELNSSGVQNATAGLSKTSAQGVSGVQGTAFPKVPNKSKNTVAKAIKIG